MPHLATCIYFFFLQYEPGLGVSGIDPGMTFTSFPSSNGQDLNPRPFDRESSSLPTRPDFRPSFEIVYLKVFDWTQTVKTMASSAVLTLSVQRCDVIRIISRRF